MTMRSTTPAASDLRATIIRQASVWWLEGAVRTESIKEALRSPVAQYENAFGGEIPRPDPFPHSLSEWDDNVVYFAARWVREASPGDDTENLHRAVVGCLKAKRRDAHLAAADKLEEGGHLSEDEILEICVPEPPAPTSSVDVPEDIREGRIRVIAAGVERQFALTGARARHVAATILYEQEAEEAQARADEMSAAAVAARRAAQMTTRADTKKHFVETILAVTRPAEEATRRAYPNNDA